MFITYCCLNPCLLIIFNIYKASLQTIIFNDDESTIDFGADQYIDQIFNYGKNGNARAIGFKVEIAYAGVSYGLGLICIIRMLVMMKRH